LGKFGNLQGGRGVFGLLDAAVALPYQFSLQAVPLVIGKGLRF
jgi:hypothetical protein